MKPCPVCGHPNPDDANFCSHCGYAFPVVAEPVSETPRLKPGWRAFWLSLLLSLAVSLILMVVLDVPVFVFGLFLPLIWQLRPKTQQP